MPIDGYSSIHIKGPPKTLQYTTTTLEKVNNTNDIAMKNRTSGYMTSPQLQRQIKLNSLIKYDGNNLSANTTSPYYGNNLMYANYNNNSKNLIQNYPDNEHVTNYNGIVVSFEL